MSHTHQDERPAAGASPLSAPQREVATDATPAVRKYGANQTYASEVPKFDKVRRYISKEMDGRWLGAIPVVDFLSEFLRPADTPLPHLPADPFRSVPRDGADSFRYDEFITTIQGWMPHLKAVNTSNKEDTTNNLRLRTDLAIYDRLDGVAPPERTDFSRMELWMEFKSRKQGVAFRDPGNSEEARRLVTEEGSFTPDTVEGINTRGQLAHYAGAQHSKQFRHFSFSILVEGNDARFLRWDPAGTVVTAAFDYRESPELIAEFLWRFDHMSAGERGHDESVQPADLQPEADARVREKLGIKDPSVPLYRYTVPGLIGKGYAYGPRPPTQNRSLVSRCTRSLPVVWIPAANVNEGNKSYNERPWCEEGIIYMKDTWRFLSDLPNVEVMPEHEIYEILHDQNTPNIPEHVAGGDVASGRTRTQEFIGAEWLCVKPRVSPFQHYRLVHGVVGRALFKFECTKQLVTAVLDALKAHSHAFDKAKVLHRDISAGNIILTDDGRGLLIDWELAKDVNEVGSRRPDRTGTWQFMSANLLRHPGKVHTFTDDLESFLHVLGWMMLRYVPAVDSYESDHRRDDLQIFDEHSVRRGFHRGGVRKCESLRGESYPSDMFQAKDVTPLSELLTDLSKPFKSFYAVRPPTDKDRKKIRIPKSEYNENMEDLSRDIRRYDRDIEKLASSSFFVNEIQNALDEKSWPIDDKADSDLPIAPLEGETEIQRQRQTTQFQNTHSLWANSKGVPGSSKRPAPRSLAEPSSKRHRSTPAGSGLSIS